MMDSSSYNHLKTNRKEIQNYVAFLTVISNFIINIQVILRSFYLQLSETVDFLWTLELQRSVDSVKKELKDGTLRLTIRNSEEPFYISCDAPTYGFGAALLQKKSIWENGAVILLKRQSII